MLSYVRQQEGATLLPNSRAAILIPAKCAGAEGGGKYRLEATDMTPDPVKALMAYATLVRTTEITGELVRTHFLRGQVPKS
jgi:hypothetical protein